MTVPTRLLTLFFKEHETIMRLFCRHTIGPIKQPQLLIMSGYILQSNLCPKRYKSSSSNWLHSLMREMFGINLLSLGHITLCFARRLCEKCLRDTTSPPLTHNCVVYIFFIWEDHFLFGETLRIYGLKLSQAINFVLQRRMNEAIQTFLTE